MEERERGLLPLDDDTTGCTLVFEPVGRMYQPMAVLAGLPAREFSGVCECYLRPAVRRGRYVMGVALGLDPKTTEGDWWSEFVGNVEAGCADEDEVRLSRSECEYVSAAELRATMLHAGTAGFVDGAAVWVSDPLGPDPDSPFTGLCRRIHAAGGGWGVLTTAATVCLSRQNTPYFGGGLF